mgnify:CR=1 FL=1
MLDDYERVKEDLYIRIVSTNKKVTVLERGITERLGISFWGCICG